MDHFLGKIWGYPGSLTVPPATGDICAYLHPTYVYQILQVNHVINSRSTRQAASSLFERWDINQNGQVTNKKKKNGMNLIRIRTYIFTLSKVLCLIRYSVNVCLLPRGCGVLNVEKGFFCVNSLNKDK